MIDPGTFSSEEFIRIAAQLTGRKLARYLDSTLLDPRATEQDILNLTDQAIRLGAHICVNPHFVPLVKERLENTKDNNAEEIRISTVVAFPLGTATTQIKIAEAEEALRLGADEIDMVANADLLKNGRTEEYADDIGAVASVIANHERAAGTRCALKVIIECCLLSDEEKQTAARIIRDAGLKSGMPIFVKTSTGYATPPPGKVSGATIEDVLLLRETVRDYDPESNPVGVKPAGGIRNSETAIRMLIAAGAFDDNLKPHPDSFMVARIGASSAGAIISDSEKST